MSEEVKDTKPTNEEIVESISVYARDGIQIHTMMRDVFIEKDNVMGVMKHQGSLDTINDIVRILNGGKVATLAEMQADIKKTQATDQSYLR